MSSSSNPNSPCAPALQARLLQQVVHCSNSNLSSSWKKTHEDDGQQEQRVRHLILQRAQHLSHLHHLLQVQSLPPPGLSLPLLPLLQDHVLLLLLPSHDA